MPTFDEEFWKKKGAVITPLFISEKEKRKFYKAFHEMIRLKERERRARKARASRKRQRLYR